jgi:hypothetical protein
MEMEMEMRMEPMQALRTTTPSWTCKLKGKIS